jgi:hypothetical protein
MQSSSPQVSLSFFSDFIFYQKVFSSLHYCFKKFFVILVKFFIYLFYFSEKGEPKGRIINFRKDFVTEFLDGLECPFQNSFIKMTKIGWAWIKSNFFFQQKVLRMRLDYGPTSLVKISNYANKKKKTENLIDIFADALF